MHVEDDTSRALRDTARTFEVSAPAKERIRARIDERAQGSAHQKSDGVLSMTDAPRTRKAIPIRQAAAAVAGVAAVTAVVVGIQAGNTPAEASWYNGVTFSAGQTDAYRQSCVDRAYTQWKGVWAQGPQTPETAAAAINSAKVVFAENRGDTAALVLETDEGTGFVCVAPIGAYTDGAIDPWLAFGLDLPTHIGTETFKTTANEDRAGAEVWFDQASADFVRYETTLQSGKQITGTVQNGYYYVVDVYNYTLTGEGRDDQTFEFTDREPSQELSEDLFQPAETRFFREDGTGVTVTYDSNSLETGRTTF